MNHKTRLWLETLLAVIATAVTAATLLWSTWFETLLGDSPDGGTGSLERVVHSSG